MNPVNTNDQIRFRVFGLGETRPKFPDARFALISLAPGSERILKADKLPYSYATIASTGCHKAPVRLPAAFGSRGTLARSCPRSI
jgi:hypothetical protein